MMLKVSDIKKDLNIGLRQAYELVNQPDFPAIRIGAKQWRIPSQAYENWKAAQCKGYLKEA